MVTTLAASSPQYSIAQSDKGWLLVIENEHCSVMQVFSSAAAAHGAIDRMMEFFEAMSTQPPSHRAA